MMLAGVKQNKCQPPSSAQFCRIAVQASAVALLDAAGTKTFADDAKRIAIDLSGLLRLSSRKHTGNFAIA